MTNGNRRRYTRSRVKTHLTVDKCFVDKGFGFGKVPTGEIVFTDLCHPL